MSGPCSATAGTPQGSCGYQRRGAQSAQLSVSALPVQGRREGGWAPGPWGSGARGDAPDWGTRDRTPVLRTRTTQDTVLAGLFFYLGYEFFLLVPIKVGGTIRQDCVICVREGSAI
ncbi:hypothetical protein NDU88_006878 [Pleurodeles waltl]|uniref:Uncharacterized protein n=1 Tax=Pleurodeles waltl TaxID=8319 RepID=A0AAV7N5B9_PLEWA|nr:hypothetical protein NDU88_006878 [Pleurodeles waltl]